jgi:hypothetical protein
MNLNDYLDKLLPWDFPIRHDGNIYKTRAPLVADLALLEQLDSAGRAGLAGLRDTLKGLFVGEAPNLDPMPFEALIVIAKLYVAHFQQHSKKNLAAMGLKDES